MKCYVQLKNSKTKSFGDEKYTLMGTDWMEKFKLYDMPKNSFSKKIESLTNETDILKKELKAKFT